MTHREARPERKTKRPRPKPMDFSPDDLYIDEPKKREKYLQLKKAFMKAHVLDVLSWSEESGDEPIIQISALTNAMLNRAASTADVSSPDAPGNKPREETQSNLPRKSPTPPTDGTPYRVVYIDQVRASLARKRGSVSSVESVDKRKEVSSKSISPNEIVAPVPNSRPINSSGPSLSNAITSSRRRMPTTHTNVVRHKSTRELSPRARSPEELITPDPKPRPTRSSEQRISNTTTSSGRRVPANGSDLVRQKSTSERSFKASTNEELITPEPKLRPAKTSGQSIGNALPSSGGRAQATGTGHARTGLASRQSTRPSTPQEKGERTLSPRERVAQVADAIRRREAENAAYWEAEREREEREPEKTAAHKQQLAERSALRRQERERVNREREEAEALEKRHKATVEAYLRREREKEDRAREESEASGQSVRNATASSGRRVAAFLRSDIEPLEQPHIATGVSSGRPSPQPSTATHTQTQLENMATSSEICSPEPSFLGHIRAVMDHIDNGKFCNDAATDKFVKAASPIYPTDNASHNDPEKPTEPSKTGYRPVMSSDKPASTDRYAKNSSSTIGKPRGGEEVRAAALGSSLRVSRVGKVAGSFLSGPARRGRKKQHEDERTPEDDVISAPAVDVEPMQERRVPTPPPPVPITATALVDENEPPPTFRRAKPSSFALLDKVNHETLDEERVLAERGINAPNRSAPAPPLPPPKMSVLDTATAGAGAATASHPRKRRNQITLNGKTFTKLDCIGKGGSSRVYRVMAENHKMFALKKVSLEDENEENIQSFKGEIDLLKKLDGVDRVVRLYDYEINDQKKSLSVLMEMGELDLASIISRRLNPEGAKFDPSFTRHYWKEMVQCVEAIHQHDVVHSDLKPANFLLAQGRLKLIDFGIADAINDNTVNLHRNQHVGTPNYMSPESIVDFNAKSGASSGPRVMKLGKPSDIWSLGVILYQMVYGKCPFSHITNQYKKIMAIPDPEHIIYFAPNGVGGAPIPSSLRNTMKMCLQRDQSLRPTAKELLDESDPFLYPDRESDDILKINQATLGRIITNVVNHCARNGIPTGEQLTTWPAGFFGKIKQVQRDERENRQRRELRQWHEYKWGTSGSEKQKEMLRSIGLEL